MCLPISTLFPYTTLFRSEHQRAGRAEARGQVLRRLRVGNAPQQALVHALRQRQCRKGAARRAHPGRSEEHTSELQSPCNLVCRLLLEKKKIRSRTVITTK